MSRALRIAIFLNTFPAISETFILRQITGLLDLGHEVDLYANAALEPGAPVHPEARSRGLFARTTCVDAPPETTVFEMPVRPLFGRTWPPGSPTPKLNLARLTSALPRLFRGLLCSPSLVRQLLSRAEYRYQADSLSGLYRLATLSRAPKKYDILHAHFGPVGNSFRFTRQLFRAPFLVSFHGYDFSTLPRKDSPDMYQRLFATADKIVVNSEFTRSRLLQLNCPAPKLVKIPVGLNPDQFPFRERKLLAGEPVRLLSVARLVPIKGHEFVLRALAQLQGQHPNLQYDIVGDGPLRPHLEKLASELGLQNIVRFHGACNGEAVARFLDAAHLFLLCSVNIDGDMEGQGLALQEAQAAGLPVIATQHGALPEGLLPNQSGFLVPERDVSALAAQISAVISRPACWPELGATGSRFVRENYDIRKLTLDLLQVYYRAIDSFYSQTSS